MQQVFLSTALRFIVLFIGVLGSQAFSNVVIVDQQSNAINNNWWFFPTNNPKQLEIWAYTGKVSYANGENLDIYVNTTAKKYAITVYRDGAVKEVVYRQTGLEGKTATTTTECYRSGCNWPVSAYVTIGNKWRSGGYIVQLTAMDEVGNKVDHHAFFVLRPKSKRNKIAMIMSTATWMAYNDWGGGNLVAAMEEKSHYQVSSKKPWSKGMIELPNGAPWVALHNSLKPQELDSTPRYPDIEWASAYSYSKFYANAGWATYESRFVKWAERNNYAIDFYAQQDLDANPALLNGYKVVIIAGHDAFWTANMRTNMDAYLQAGGKLARFAGGFLWQARYNADRSILTSYRFDATDEDPVAASNTEAEKLTTTTMWASKLIKKPGVTTVGGNGYRGLLANTGAISPRSSGGFTVYRPDHWSLRNTGLYYGDILGGNSAVVGYASDGIDYSMVNGQPVPTGADGTPENTTIVALAPTSIVEQNFGLPGELLPKEQADLRSYAKIIFGNASQANLAKLRYGSAVVSVVPAGSGEIFCACTSGWVMGLHNGDKFIEQVTNNVLQRYLR